MGEYDSRKCKKKVLIMVILGYILILYSLEEELVFGIAVKPIEKIQIIFILEQFVAYINLMMVDLIVG